MSRESRIKWLAYLTGVPLIALLHYPICLELFGEAFAAGEAALMGRTEPFRPIQDAGFLVLGFPFYYILPAFGVLPLSGNQTIFLATALNGLFWGFALVTLGLLIRKRMQRAGVTKDSGVDAFSERK